MFGFLCYLTVTWSVKYDKFQKYVDPLTFREARLTRFLVRSRFILRSAQVMNLLVSFHQEV